MRTDTPSSTRAKATRPSTLSPALPAAPDLPPRFDADARRALLQLLTRLAQSASALLATLVLFAAAEAGTGTLPPHLRLWASAFPLLLLLMPARDNHRLRDRRLTERLRLLAQAINAAAVLAGLALVCRLAGLAMPPLPLLLGVLVLHVLLAGLSRRALLRLWRHVQLPLRVVVVGADAQGVALAQLLAQRRAPAEAPTQVVGFVDDRSDRIDRGALPAPFLGSVLHFVRFRRDVDGVVIALPNSAADRVQAIATTLRDGRINVYLAPEAPLLNPDLAHAQGGLQDMVLLGMERLPLGGRIAKRLFDIAFASLALLVFLPFGLLIAVLIRLESPGPAIFRQKRYGLGYRLFDVYKFRSMRFDPQAARGEIRLTQRGDSRVTRLGDFLRRSSLDEFPQFLNVLLGHMSVVGPRPHPPGVKAGQRVYEEVVADFMERYKVRPGITGWAQVSGLRGNTFTEEHLTRRFEHDVEYIRNWSFELDLWIVLKTVFGGFGGKNAF